MSNIIPERGINFSVYHEGRDLLGVAEGSLPNLESITSDISGAGVAGTVSSPVLGHFGSLELSLTWRNVTKDIFKLAGQYSHNIDLYAAMQDYNAGRGVYKVNSLHVYVKAIPKNITIGNLVSGDTTGTTTALECTYMKIDINNNNYAEIDKFNYICKIRGVDYLAEVRSALGKGNNFAGIMNLL